MRRLPRSLTVVLLLLGCGDDLPDPRFVGSMASGSTTDTTGIGDTVVTSDPPTTTTTTGTLTTTGEDTTGPVAECGNGKVEDGEGCDDQNLDEYDGCYSSCTLAFEEQWTKTQHYGSVDAANDALFDGDGNLYVLGNGQVEGPDQVPNQDLWLRKYAPDGDAEWTWLHNGSLGGDDYGRRLAWHESGDLLIVGSEVTENEDDVLVVRFDVDDQDPVWTRYHDGSSLGPMPIDDADVGNDITADSNGNVLVAGSVRVDGQPPDLWLRKYDDGGGEEWTHTHVHAGADAAVAVLADARDDIYLVGNLELASGSQEGWVQKLDTNGEILWSNPVPGVTLTHGALDPQGDVVLVGFAGDPEESDMWAGKYDSDFQPRGDTQEDLGYADEARGVAVGGAGDVYMTGFVTVIGESRNVWIGRYRSNLNQRWWSDIYNNPRAHLDDEGHGVALTSDDTRLAVVGIRSTFDEGSDIWVRVYRNNPTPLAQ
jgi:cysteine-rich repeat protein